MQLPPKNIPFKQNKFPAFTFIELMIILVIVSVVLAIAAPRLGRFYNSVKLDGNAQQLRLFLMYARNTALAARKRCIFYYVAKKREFFLEILRDPKKYPDQYIPTMGNLSHVKLSNGVNLIRAQQVGSRPIPENTDFSMPIVPMGNKYEYYFTLEGVEHNKVHVIVRAGSGIVEIEKEPKKQ